MEKRLKAFITFSIIVGLCCMVIALIIFSKSSETCTTRDCVQSASELMSHLDTSVPPCSDFYEFTCGSFLKKLDENQSEHLSDYMENYKNDQISHIIGEEPNIYDPKELLATKSLYRECLNESAIDEFSLGPIKKILKEMGGWPLLERGDWREIHFDWKNATHRLRIMGIEFDHFLSVDIDLNSGDTTKHIISIKPGNVQYIEDGNKLKYHEYIVDVSAYFGADRNRAQRVSKEIIEFQTQLEKISNGSLESHGRLIKYADLHNPKALSQIQYELPSVPWVNYINGIIYPNATVTSDEVVNIVNIEKIKKVLYLINKTPKRILANYIAWCVIQKNLINLPKTLREIDEKYKEKIGIYRKKSRSEMCIGLVQERMIEAVESSYAKRYISDNTKHLIKDIIDHIKKEFNKILDVLDWVDEDAKEVAKEKLASIRDYIAYTAADIQNKGKLEAIYDEVQNNKHNFMETLLAINTIRLNMKFDKLNQPVYEGENTEPLYVIRNNNLVLPSFYLQGMYFNEKRPQYLNYGAIGTIIAYQLANLLLEGRRYDLYGNLREWSSSQSLLNYDSRAKCISEQYKEFYIPGLGRNINATLTRDDDVATHFGKKIAYEAYLSWSEEHQNEDRLPGLGYTPRQLFWISSAMYECGQWVKDEILHEIFDKHRSISRLRVLGSLRNSADFIRDFNCPSGSFMNVEDKCLLW